MRGKCHFIQSMKSGFFSDLPARLNRNCNGKICIFTIGISIGDTGGPELGCGAEKHK